MFASGDDPSEPSPPAPDKDGERCPVRPCIVDAIRNPAMIVGKRERQLDPPQQLAFGQTHPPPSVLGVSRNVVEAVTMLRKMI